MKILHSADWHMDSPFTGYTQQQREYLHREQLRIPRKVAELCKKEKCDVVLLSGDIFDGPYTGESLEAVRSGLEDCGCPVFVAPGSHDFCGAGSPWTEESWPANVYVFRGALESVTLPRLDCRIYGAGYQSECCPDLLENFQAEGKERFCLAVLHGDATGADSTCCPMTAAQIRDSGLDYLALGHTHRRDVLNAGATICGWPGCPMGRGFEECGEQGAYVVTLGEGHDVRFVPLNLTRFYELELDTGADAAAALENIFPSFGSRDFYRITLTGRGKGSVRELYEEFQHISNLELLDRRQNQK